MIEFILLNFFEIRRKREQQILFFFKIFLNFNEFILIFVEFLSWNWLSKNLTKPYLPTSISHTY